MIKLLSIFLVMTTLLTVVSYRFIRLPPTIGVMVAGLLFSLAVQGLSLAGFPIVETHTLEVLNQIDFESVVMDGMLPVLLFAGALHVKIHDLRAYRWPIGSLATGGVLISTFAIGTLTYLILPLFGWEISFLYALLWAALIASTDAVACLASLKSAGAPVYVRSILCGEALLNDGVSIVIFSVLAAIIGLGVTPSAGSVGMLFLHEAGGGVALGLVLGFVVIRLMKTVDQYHIEFMLSLSAIVGGAVLASELHVSAALAMVVSGLLIGNIGLNEGMSAANRKSFIQTYELIDEVLTCGLFCMMGLELLLLPFSLLHIGAALVLSVAIIASRFMTVAPAALFKQMISGRRTVPKGTVRVLTWGGLRGGVSIALALTIPVGPERDLLLSLTYIVVVFSILGQGLTIGPLVSRIYGASAEISEDDETIEPVPSH